MQRVFFNKQFRPGVSKQTATRGQNMEYEAITIGS